MKFQILILLVSAFILPSCLKTRSEYGATQQSQIYRKKNIENQNSESETVIPKIDERDELIRNLNGRVESLESQLQQLQKEKIAAQQTVSPDAQKVLLMQDALMKMELQIQKLEGEKSTSATTATASHKASEKSSDSNLGINKENTAQSAKSSAKQSAFDIAEEHFEKKEWKKAILSYQASVEEFPKGKTVAESKYKIGVCFQELGLKDEASAFYEEVIAQYPKQESGKKAKIRLATLNQKPNAKSNTKSNAKKANN